MTIWIKRRTKIGEGEKEENVLMLVNDKEQTREEKYIKKIRNVLIDF